MEVRCYFCSNLLDTVFLFDLFLFPDKEPWEAKYWDGKFQITMGVDLDPFVLRGRTIPIYPQGTLYDEKITLAGLSN